MSQTMKPVRDSFWLWGHAAGVHCTGNWGLPPVSRMTPAEAAMYMGIPNMLMVGFGKPPQPPSDQYEQYAISFRSLNRVVWSIVGAGALTGAEDRARALALAHRHPNITGVIMDDFFNDLRRGRKPPLSPDELREVRRALVLPDRRLDLWVVLYDMELALSFGEYLDLCDKVTFWTWHAKDLDKLEDNFARAEKLAPRAGKILGIYMWDYGDKKPIPVEVMERQCETGLKWLREGRIEGMIFLPSCICDMELEAVEWTRRWIAKRGSEVMPA